ncbi:MAG: alpha/beta hydrolase [Devosiaceae bacterium]|nr:alpha/beta hydrolase [Devosiaceae bacterium]
MIIKILIGFVIILFLIPVAGFTYQLIGQYLDEQKFPPPGDMISIGDYSLHLNCQGNSEVTVIMEAGAGGDSLTWSSVQPNLSQTMRVCTYDRAGMGWSEAGPAPRSADLIVSDLNKMLANASISGPMIFVGHSFGGLVAQYYARAFPERVVGMVLVDSVHPDFIASLPQSAKKQRESQLSLLKFGGLLTRFGVARALNVVSFPSEMPEEIRRNVRALAMRPLAASTIYAETVAFEKGVEEMEKLPQLSADLPIAVISRYFDKSNPSHQDNVEVDRLWSDLQAELAKLNDNTEQYFSKSSDHFIQFSDPELIINIIRDITAKSSVVSN